MQLYVHIELDEPLVLPINYNHIIQAVIYRTLSVMPDYTDFLHNRGYSSGHRQYKMFQFSQLKGKYRIKEKSIIFYSFIELEIRSPEPLLIQLLDGGFRYGGITFGQKNYKNIRTKINDFTVEKEELIVKTVTPIVVYSTDSTTKYTVYYSPEDIEFYEEIQNNAYRKYQAYYEVEPDSYVEIREAGDMTAKKLVTKYQAVILKLGMEILFYQVNVNISISYIRQALAPRTPRVLECSISSKIAIRT